MNCFIKSKYSIQQNISSLHVDKKTNIISSNVLKIIDIKTSETMMVETSQVHGLMYH